MSGSILGHFDMLESAGHIEGMWSLLSEITSTMPKDARFKSNCKKIFSVLLDKLGRNPEFSSSELRKAFEPKTKVSKSPPPSQSAQISQFLRKERSRQRILNMSYSALKQKKKKPDDFMAPQRNQLSLISDFKSITGNVKFSKSKRELNFFSPNSPGPGAYHPRVDMCKPSSPKISVPHENKRFEFRRENSPGSFAYYPQIHYLSK